MRSVYPTCALPDCTVPFGRCEIHHVHWWEHDGLTDLDNLVPTCIKHHHRVHDGGWDLHLAPDRTLTTTLPDGSTVTTGPPQGRAA